MDDNKLNIGPFEMRYNDLIREATINDCAEMLIWQKKYGQII